MVHKFLLCTAECCFLGSWIKVNLEEVELGFEHVEFEMCVSPHWFCDLTEKFKWRKDLLYFKNFVHAHLALLVLGGVTQNIMVGTCGRTQLFILWQLGSKEMGAEGDKKGLGNTLFTYIFYPGPTS